MLVFSIFAVACLTKKFFELCAHRVQPFFGKSVDFELLVRRLNYVTLFALSLLISNVFVPRAPIWQKRIDYTLVIALAFQISVWASIVVDYWVTRQRKKYEPSAFSSLNLVSAALRVGLWVAIALFALNNLGVNITALVAGLGIGGIAAGLALQNILGDLFASLAIVMDEPFLVGDFIVFGDETGTIESIGLKTTRIRSLSGEQIICANSDLLSSRIRNFKRMRERRVQFSIRIAFDTAPEKLRKICGIVSETIKKREGVRLERCHFKEIGAYSHNFEIVYWVLNADYNAYMDIQQDINVELLERLSGSEIAMAYPTQSLRLSRAA